MKVFIINCGSSSVKFNLFSMPGEELLAGGKAERNNGSTNLMMNWQTGSKNEQLKGFSTESILNCIFKIFQDPVNSILNSLEEIDVVGHRLIHGGERGESCVEITDALISTMKSGIQLAPLHYPPNLEGIEILKKRLPRALQTGVFDTAFHQTLPKKAFLYGIPLEWYQKHQIRKYGFHGTSHKYVAQRGCELAGLYFGKSKIISCHLGNGASVAAVKDGKSIDTSMGMTPVEGLLMGTRSGDVDAGVLIYLRENFNLSFSEIDDILNRKGGLLGLSGVSSDYREVEQAADSGNEAAQTALDVYHYRVKKYIGSYLAALGGANLLVFTGGIGENSTMLREAVCSGMEWAGISVSKILNHEMNGREAIISESGSKIKVAIVTTNEELMIARESAKLAKPKFSV